VLIPFFLEDYDSSQQEYNITFTCDDNFIMVLQELATVSILQLNWLGAFPAELKH
jgi:hypothetical protein